MLDNRQITDICNKIPIARDRITYQNEYSKFICENCGCFIGI